MTFNIITLGCKVNQYESQVMTEVMLKDGFTHSPDKDHADIFIVNTCTVTSVSDSKNRKLIRRIRRNNENAIIVVTGCMSQAFPEDEVYEICDIVVGNTNRKIISKLIKDYVANSDHYVNVEEHTGGEIFEPIKITNFEERTRAQIKIEDGCNRFCAYCIIPYARGRVRSKDINELKEEATDLASKGFREIVEREKPENIVLLGDLYYHGPRNELSQEYEPMKVAKILNEMKDKLLVVRGNCDAEVDEMISEFKFNDHILMEINGKKFYFTHGHKYNIENIPYDDFDIMIYGHIHQGFIEEKEGLVFANPGSISLPKCNSHHSYIILDENKIILKDVDGKVLQEYEY